LQISSSGKFPIISISQKPIDFGENICVGEIGASNVNVYKQILVGAKAAKTKYVFCCEDDSMYNEEHFAYRPPSNAFCYNLERWNVSYTFFFHRRMRPGMCMCVAPTELMVSTLELRLATYPDGPKNMGFGEPGRYEWNLNLPTVELVKFRTKSPTLTFHHRPSLGGRRGLLRSDIVVEELAPWGKAVDLWREVHG
jgi:hypothetical protein